MTEDSHAWVISASPGSSTVEIRAHCHWIIAAHLLKCRCAVNGEDSICGGAKTEKTKGVKVAAFFLFVPSWVFGYSKDWSGCVYILKGLGSDAQAFLKERGWDRGYRWAGVHPKLALGRGMKSCEDFLSYRESWHYLPDPIVMGGQAGKKVRLCSGWLKWKRKGNELGKNLLSRSGWGWKKSVLTVLL